MTIYYFTPTQSNSPWVPGDTFTISAFFELTTGLANGDTIVWQNAVTPSGIAAIDVRVVTTQLDSNASPTGAFSFGDSDAYSPTDAYAAARYILAGAMGTNQSGKLVVNYSNVAPVNITVTPSYPPNSPSYVVQANGIGYNYTNSENSPTNEPGGFLDLVYTVTAAPATAASSGTVWAYFTYYCIGNP
jgi:hypothetical protein